MKCITLDQAAVGAWFATQFEFPQAMGPATYVGLLDTDTGQLVAAVKYDGYNKTSLNIHVAAAAKGWLTREFLWFTFHYPFEQLGVQRLTGLVPESNLPARRFNEHLGFIFEAALEKACSDGRLLVYRMFREDCRWLTLNENRHEKTPPSALHSP